MKEGGMRAIVSLLAGVVMIPLALGFLCLVWLSVRGPARC